MNIKFNMLINVEIAARINGVFRFKSLKPTIYIAYLLSELQPPPIGLSANKKNITIFLLKIVNFSAIKLTECCIGIEVD